MASGKSAYLEAALLDHVFGKTIWTPPDEVFFALTLEAFDPDLTGTELVEPGAGGYARAQLANSVLNFPDAISSNPAQKLTGTDIVFPVSSAAWGVLVAIYAVDADSAGNVLYGADLPVQVPISGAGGAFAVPAGSGIFTEV